MSFNFSLPLSFFQSLPNGPSPNFDGTKINGSLPTELKQLNANILYWSFTGSSEKSTIYNMSVGERVRIVEMEIDASSGLRSPRSKVVYEFSVTQEDCNSYGILHGGCAAYLADVCGPGPITGLGLALGLSLWGPTKDLNVKYLKPGNLGSILKITSTMVPSDRVGVFAVNIEIADKGTNTLIVAATQTRFVPRENFESKL